MSSMTDKTVKGLAPQSWTSVLVWAVLVVIYVSAPIQATRLVVEVVGGTGRWIAYTAFADCGSRPPMEWMTTKRCDGQGIDTGGTPAAFNLDPNSPESQGVVDQAVAQVEDMHRVVASAFEIDTTSTTSGDRFVQADDGTRVTTGGVVQEGRP
ncbi:MAG: hypothetical protein OEY70_14290 [Acidimicrobiia bacterium]|nr:hypothetical protein [Acidimicrobiia bacterium]